ncbi:RusA family crossover junction endodeoxyribonuclease [Chloroflexota bacterium]
MGVDLFIEGIPYGQRKPRGDIEAPDRWTQAVKQATKSLPKVQGPCYMIVVFVLPKDKYPSDHPHGPDLDNLMKRLLDALNNTVFSGVAGKDGSVVHLVVSKRKAMQNEPTGARVIIADTGD